MNFSPSEFRSQIDSRGSFQKLEHYDIFVPVAPIMGPLASQGQPISTTNQGLIYYSDSIDLAGVSLGTLPIVRYGYGTSEKKPFAPIFNDIMITFYADGESNNLGYFQAWMMLINNFNMQKGINSPQNSSSAYSPYELQYKDDYAVDLIITIYDNSGNPIRAFALREAYPIDIPSIKMGWAMTQDIMRVTVLFTFVDWYIVSNIPNNNIPNGVPITQTNSDSNIPMPSQVAAPAPVPPPPSNVVDPMRFFFLDA